MGQAKLRGSFEQRKLEALQFEADRQANLEKERNIAKLARTKWEKENPELAAKQKRMANEIKTLLAVAEGMRVWKY